MNGFWTETRPNGRPIEAGTVCWVQELGEGLNPIYVYGRDTQEVIDKLSRNNAHAQAALARRAVAPATAAATPPAPAATQARARLTPGQVMQATVDLQNPAKAGEAVSALLADATGLDPVEMGKQRYATLAIEWENEHPEFDPHPGNRYLLGDKAIRRAGGKPALVTKELMTQCFNELLAEGLLFEATSEQLEQQTHGNLTTFPGESQVQRTERPRGALFATGARSSNFRAPQQVAQTRTLKYTKEQIDRMSLAKSRDLIERGDKDYTAACEAYYPSTGQATA
jgi:hypothetical protein